MQLIIHLGQRALNLCISTQVVPFILPLTADVYFCQAGIGGFAFPLLIVFFFCVSFTIYDVTSMEAHCSHPRKKKAGLSIMFCLCRYCVVIFYVILCLTLLRENDDIKT